MGGGGGGVSGQVGQGVGEGGVGQVGGGGGGVSGQVGQGVGGSMLHYPLLPSETILANSGMNFYRHEVKYLGV